MHLCCIYILSIALLLIYSFNWFCHTQIWAKQINRKLNLAVGAHQHSQTRSRAHNFPLLLSYFTCSLCLLVNERVRGTVLDVLLSLLDWAQCHTFVSPLVSHTLPFFSQGLFHFTHWHIFVLHLLARIHIYPLPFHILYFSMLRLVCSFCQSQTHTLLPQLWFNTHLI